MYLLTYVLTNLLTCLHIYLHTHLCVYHHTLDGNTHTAKTIHLILYPAKNIYLFDLVLRWID